MMNVLHVKEFELALVYENGHLTKVLESGRHRLWDLFKQIEVKMVNLEKPWLSDELLRTAMHSPLLKKRVTVIQLAENERALVKIDGRFDRVVGPGTHGLWHALFKVEVERFDITEVVFNHQQLNAIVNTNGAENWLTVKEVGHGQVGLLFEQGELKARFQPGVLALWKESGRRQFFTVEMRDQVMEVNSQDIMTSDKVSVRVSAILNYRVQDAEKCVSRVERVKDKLYRDLQMTLRELVGSLELDELLTSKDRLTEALTGQMKSTASYFGVEITGAGLRDIILPGEIKTLMNQVTEARKRSEANLITRREELAAVRTQMNTAKILDSSPILMRLKELEFLEKIAEKSDLNVILGEKGLRESVLKML